MTKTEKHPTIQRSPHDAENPYTMIRNDLIRDKSISPECRLVLIYLLSLPVGWKIRIPHLINEFKGHIGKDRMYVLIKEAMDAGYMMKEMVRVPQKNGGIMEYPAYYLSESRKYLRIYPSPENPDPGDPDAKERKKESNDSKEIPSPQAGPPPDASRRLSFFFFEELKKNKPNTIAQKHSKKALDASKQLLKVRTEDELKKTILEAFKHEFWKNVLTSIDKLRIHLDAIELAVQQKPKATTPIDKNREVLRLIKERYPDENKYGVQYESDAIIFTGGAEHTVCRCTESNFLEKISTPLKNRKMEMENG